MSNSYRSCPAHIESGLLTCLVRACLGLLKPLQKVCSVCNAGTIAGTARFPKLVCLVASSNVSKQLHCLCACLAGSMDVDSYEHMHVDHVSEGTMFRSGKCSTQAYTQCTAPHPWLRAQSRKCNCETVNVLQITSLTALAIATYYTRSPKPCIHLPSHKTSTVGTLYHAFWPSLQLKGPPCSSLDITNT